MRIRGRAYPPDVAPGLLLDRIATRLLATSIGSVLVIAHGEFLWALSFDEAGKPKGEVFTESLLEVEEGWTVELMKLGLPEGEARMYARELLAIDEKYFEAWLASLPERKRRRQTKYYEDWKMAQEKARQQG
jgi:hypothetical protein